MLQMEQWMTIHALIAQGLSQREIARRLGISRNTVARYATSDDVSCYPGEGLVAELKSLFPSFTLRNGVAATLECKGANTSRNLTEVHMSRTTSSTINRIRRRSEPAVGHTRMLEGEALLKDMRAYRKKVTASPEAARKFLIELGVLTPDGKKKNLIRG